VFAAGRRAKWRQQAELAAALTAVPELEPAESELDALVDVVVDRLRSRLTDTEQEPEHIFTGAAPFKSGGFDGGARQPVPPRKDPEREHAELLGHLVAAARMYRSAGF